MRGGKQARELQRGSSFLPSSFRKRAAAFGTFGRSKVHISSNPSSGDDIFNGRSVGARLGDGNTCDEVREFGGGAEGGAISDSERGSGTSGVSSASRVNE